MGIGVRKWFARFSNGNKLDGFLGTREISKPQNMIKKFGDVDESFARDTS